MAPSTDVPLAPWFTPCHYLRVMLPQGMPFRFLFLLCVSVWSLQAAKDAPNVIYILADDLGYGDLSHAGGKALTPHCDRLAREGIRFTDSHTTSSVCTPTRYGILTGRYNWRSTLKKSVLDPQGTVIQQALNGMGFKNVNEVRQGKFFEINIDEKNQRKAEEKADEMCKKLLANLVIEDYKIIGSQ